ncbi:MAG: hypothetical protein U0Q16_29700 [Bryobacteraceae bacterium]
MIRLTSLLLAALAAAAQDNQEILSKLSEITGLAVLRPVVQHNMKRSELKSYFEARIAEAVKPEEIRLEELALKKLGFVPADFDLKKTTVELMSEQAAAFYDYRKKKMVMLEETGSGMMQDLALVHELGHALADQHFNLEKFLRKSGADDDSSLARMAVMEGQATWLMSEYMAKRMGQSLLESPSMVDMMTRMAGAGGSGFPVFQSVPLYMRETLVFPYAQGMAFQQKLAEKLGKQAFTEIFKRPPQSTQEILHADKYFAHVAHAKPALPQLANEKQWKALVEGITGELDHQILIKQYAHSYELAAEQWTGGVYRLWENKKDRRVVLAYASSWSSEKAATDFMGIYKRVLKGKWKQVEFSDESENRLAGKSEDGFFVTLRNGSTVTSLEGLPSAGGAKGM